VLQHQVRLRLPLPSLLRSYSGCETWLEGSWKRSSNPHKNHRECDQPHVSTIKKSTPRLFLFLLLVSSSGAFQVHVVKPGENKEIYSKFQTKAFPDPQQLAESVNTFIKNGQIDFSGQFFSYTSLSLVYVTSTGEVMPVADAAGGCSIA
jgi:hypothetical protein